MNDLKKRDGFRVVGHNTADERLSCWYFPTLEAANIFAKSLCEDTKKEVDVCKYIGSWRPAQPPAEFVVATDPNFVLVESK